jgi:hypothetical protein
MGKRLYPLPATARLTAYQVGTQRTVFLQNALNFAACGFPEFGRGHIGMFFEGRIEGRFRVEADLFVNCQHRVMFFDESRSILWASFTR